MSMSELPPVSPVRTSRYNNVNVDETALLDTLEGIAEPGHFFEVVYNTRDTLPHTFLCAFPAHRVIFRSAKYVIERFYIGDICQTDQQGAALWHAYMTDLIDYERVYPEAWGDVNANE